MKKLTAGVALASVVLLTACFGDGDGDGGPVTSDPTASVPDSASTSVDGFINYLKALVVVQDDTLEPVDTASVMAQTDDTSEPATVD